jgi:hypothetical protein
MDGSLLTKLPRGGLLGNYRIPVCGLIGNTVKLRPEKDRGVENPGRKSDWAFNRRGVIVLPVL